MDGLSMNLEQTNMDKLRAVFPECFAEGKLDIDKLLSLCGEYISNDFEKYKFEWKGKAECLRLAQKRSTGTLRPCPEESVNWDTTQNLYIEGDNLEVLKLLQTTYYRKVKMIYIDPPYNIILDFFSGSATTAHAVMQMNAEDDGNRRFILVQLPELCPENSDAYKAGYKNICEIGKERIRRAGRKLLEEHAQVKLTDAEAHSLDIGFRVYKLDISNLKTWDAMPIEPEQINILYERMNNMVQRVKDDRTDLDMISEIMLKLGVPLTYPVSCFDLRGKKAYAVGEDCLLLICLAENVKPEDVEAMAEYAPAKVIISRESFADNSAMANAYYILRDREIELKLV